MIKTIGLVGVGSLGGYVAKRMQHFADRIYGIDPDIVEKRNLRNSLYTKEDIRKPKVIALKRQISECDYVPVQDDFRNVDLPDVDQLIDCRDVLNKNIKADVKFLVVGKNLRVNCEDTTEDKDVKGEYMIDLGKDDISQAGRLAAESLMSNGITNLRKKKLSINIPLSTRSVIKEVDFLVKQSDRPVADRDIRSHIFKEIKEISNERCRVKTKLCKVGDFQRIRFCEPILMSYPQVINILNDIVLRQGGTYSIDRQNDCIEICNPFLAGGA
jgi:hypothetical protein